MQRSRTCAPPPRLLIRAWTVSPVFITLHIVGRDAEMCLGMPLAVLFTIMRVLVTSFGGIQRFLRHRDEISRW